MFHFNDFAIAPQALQPCGEVEFYLDGDMVSLSMWIHGRTTVAGDDGDDNGDDDDDDDDGDDDDDDDYDDNYDDHNYDDDDDWLWLMVIDDQCARFTSTRKSRNVHMLMYSWSTLWSFRTVWVSHRKV